MQKILNIPLSIVQNMLLCGNIKVSKYQNPNIKSPLKRFEGKDERDP